MNGQNGGPFGDASLNRIADSLRGMLDLQRERSAWPDVPLATDVAPDDVLLVRDQSSGADKRLPVGLLLGEVEEIEPSVTFATPGDLSIEYGTSRLIEYVRVGRIMVLHGRIQFTPTYTTASGNLSITGMPPLTYVSQAASAGGTLIHQGGLIYPSGRTTVNWTVDTAGIITLRASGDEASLTTLGVSNVPSGTAQDFRFTGALIAAED